MKESTDTRNELMKKQSSVVSSNKSITKYMDNSQFLENTYNMRKMKTKLRNQVPTPEDVTPLKKVNKVNQVLVDRKKRAAMNDSLNYLQNIFAQTLESEAITT